MLRLSDILNGRILTPRPPVSRRPPCTPEPPRDPKPVNPVNPWCDTGPDLRILRKVRKRRSR